MSVVWVCPELDHECGDLESRWCVACPKWQEFHARKKKEAMTPDPQDLPPLPPIQKEDHPESHKFVWTDLELSFIRVYARDYAQSARSQLLAKIAEFTKHFDDVDREIDELEAMVKKVKERAEAAERERDELRAKLKAIIGAADRLHADTMYKWAPEAKDYYMKVRSVIDATLAEKP